MAYYHGNKKSWSCILWNSADVGGVVKHWAVVIGVCDINIDCGASITRLVVNVLRRYHLGGRDEGNE